MLLGVSHLSYVFPDSLAAKTSTMEKTLQIWSSHVDYLLFVLQFVDYLMKKSVVIQVWGKQIPDKKPLNKAAKEGKDTKAIMKAETMKKGMSKGSKVGPCIVFSHKCSNPKKFK